METCIIETSCVAFVFLVSPFVIASLKSLIVSSKPLKFSNYKLSYRLLVLMKKSLSKTFSFSFMRFAWKNVFNISCSNSTFPDSLFYRSFQSDWIWLLAINFVIRFNCHQEPSAWARLSLKVSCNKWSSRAFFLVISKTFLQLLYSSRLLSVFLVR